MEQSKLIEALLIVTGLVVSFMGFYLLTTEKKPIPILFVVFFGGLVVLMKIYYHLPFWKFVVGTALIVFVSLVIGVLTGVSESK